MNLNAPTAILAGIVCSAALAQDVTPLAHVETKGTGDTHLVLVPGLGCDWTVWDAFMERNADKYTMHAVTLPGMTGTDAPPEPEGNEGTPWMDNAVAAINALLEKADVNEVVIVGHSLGGTLALDMASGEHERVAGVVSVDGMAAMPLGPQPVPAEQRAMIVNGMVAPQLMSMTDEMWAMQQDAGTPMMVTDPERAKELAELTKTTSAKNGARYMVELLKTDLTAQLKDTDTPKLVLAAINDEMAAQVGGKGQLQQIWNTQVEGTGAKLVMIEGARHFVMDDAPEKLDEAIAAFVRDLGDSKAEPSE